MKIIYIDSEYMCHLENGEGRREVETDVFDGKIDAVIPYYRFIPQGEEWKKPKTKEVLHGQFIQATDSVKIDRIMQSAYITEMQDILNILTGESND